MVNPSDSSNADQFSLRWNNFHSNLSTGFHDLLEEEDLVDVTLACEGQFVQAHKIVLSVCSPYFKALFKANPCKHPIVILKDVRHRDLMSIIQFMYLGEVNVRQDELTFFLKTAEMLKVKGLTEDDKAKSSSKEPSAEEITDRSHSVNQQSKNLASSDPPSAPASKRFRRDPSSGAIAGSGSTVPTHTIPSHRPAASDSPAALSGDSSIMDATATLDFVVGSGSSSSKAPKTEPVDLLEEGVEIDDEEEDPLGGEVVMGGEEYKNLLQEASLGGAREEIMVHHPMDMGASSGSGVVGDSSVTVRSAGGGGSSAGVGSHSVSQPPPLTPATTVTSSGVSIFPSSAGSSQEGSQDYSHGGISQQLPSRFSCPVCRKEFTRKDNLKTHFENLHGKSRGPLLCPICQKVTKNRNSLRAHLYEYHRKNLCDTKLE